MAKSAKVKDFTVEQEIRNNGIEIKVDDNDGQFGDVYVDKVGVTWCKGKAKKENGVRFSWDELALLSDFKEEAIKAAKIARPC